MSRRLLRQTIEVTEVTGQRHNEERLTTILISSIQRISPYTPERSAFDQPEGTIWLQGTVVYTRETYEELKKLLS